MRIGRCRACGRRPDSIAVFDLGMKYAVACKDCRVAGEPSDTPSGAVENWGTDKWHKEWPPSEVA